MTKTPTTGMSRVTPELERAVGVVQMGATRAVIARTFGCSRFAVTYLMQRYRQTSDRPRTDAPTTTGTCIPCICGIAS